MTIFFNLTLEIKQSFDIVLYLHLCLDLAYIYLDFKIFSALFHLLNLEINTPLIVNPSNLRVLPHFRHTKFTEYSYKMQELIMNKIR